MDFELFLYSVYSVEQISKTLESIISNTLKSDVKYEVNEDYIYIGSNLFSMSLENEDVSDLDFIMKEYNVNVNLCIDIQVYNKTYMEGISEVIKVIGKLLDVIQCDALLLRDGSKQVLRRDGKELIVNKDIDNVPFEKINLLYKEEKI